MNMARWMAGGLAATLAFACAAQTRPNSSPRNNRVQKQAFGKLPDGTPVDLYTLSNAKGMQARIMTYGGAVVSLTAPDRAGRYADVVLGMDDLDGYLKGVPYFGALIGRYGNRIGNAQFTLNGKTYHLPKNDGNNTLHGGNRGFDKRVWTAHETEGGLELTYVSADGEEGFPGKLTAKVVYSVTPANELRIEYTATTDKDTVVNLTNHSYFNLAGQGEGDILGHQVTIHATRFTPVDAGLIPTGELRPVEGTPFDFRKATAIGERVAAKDRQVEYGKGIDHNWVLDGSGMRVAAEVYEPKTGRTMQVLTDQPGLQFYTGNFLDGTIHGKGGKVYGHRSAFCMETQHFPDSPNKPEFPTTVLKPGQTYHTVTVYRFSAR
ncbi:MAG TPA: aldose epimerase family protein [Bryobacteraceae bacterium]|jgi:aldose 1-epimerase|nr:aldose epimerase family protein [Bryobacteraceae bacterium]